MNTQRPPSVDAIDDDEATLALALELGPLLELLEAEGLCVCALRAEAESVVGELIAGSFAQ